MTARKVPIHSTNRWEGKYKVLYIFIGIIVILSVGILISNGTKNGNADIQVSQDKGTIVENTKMEATPKPVIQMISNLSGVVKGTEINLEYDVYNADEVYFATDFKLYDSQSLVLPSSGTTHFSQIVALDMPTTNVYIKGQNKYWSTEKDFTIEREKTAEEIQQEKEDEAFNAQRNKEYEEISKRDEIYNNSPAKLLKDKIDNLTLGEKGNLTYECKNGVKNRLPSPSSAEFPWASLNFRLKGETMVADSYVDAQNYFGAQIRNEYECIWELNGENFLLVDVKIFE